MFSSVALVLLALSPVAFSSPVVTENVTINGRAGTRNFIDFSGVSSGQDAKAFLSDHGFYVSDYDITAGPVGHAFNPDNVYFGNGVLNMKVNGYSGSGLIQSAEIGSTNAAKYGSVKVVYKSSGVPGVVEGNFFYTNDNLEIDFEMLTSTTKTASGCLPPGIWATNQPLTPGGTSTHETIPLSFAPEADFHEYRIDWDSSATTFFIDGNQVARLTENVPQEALSYIFNTWSNGDACWSNGPPTADSVTQIKSIDLTQGN